MATELKAIGSMQQRPTCRARDAHVTRGWGRRSNRVQGFTLIELLVAMSVFLIIAGTALAAMPRKPYAVWSAQAELVAELRRARNDALTKGDHFRMVVTGLTTWETQRLTLVAGNWVVSGAPVRSGTLPSGVEVTNGVGSQFEFTTRGLMLLPGAATTIQVQSVDTYHHRGVTIWPSGQVAPA